MKQPEEFYVGRWAQSNIPIKMRGLRFEDYEPMHRTGEIAVNAAQEFVDNFTDHYVSAKRADAGIYPTDRSNIGKGLLFFGRNGTRKSTLATTILTEVQYASPAYHVYYVRFSEWQRALMDSIGKDDTDRLVVAKKTLRRVQLSHLIVLDDIGQEYRTSSGFTEDKLNELLRVRYESALPTIVTTNIDPDSMRGVYGDSFASFQKDAFKTFPMLGPDTR